MANKVISSENLQKIQKFLERILEARGITEPEEVRKFLYPNLNDLSDPFAYSGMQEAVDRLKKAVDDKEKILVYGDYDCDGISAIAIFCKMFADKGVEGSYYVPSRKEEGYGLNSEAIRKIKEDFNPSLIITVDCGIGAVQEVELAKSLGMDVVVTDHHKIKDVTPDCIIVDPCFNPELTPLCGAGVAFTVMRGLFGDKYAFKFLDITGIATIGDVVPLVDDNRIIAYSAIRVIRKGLSCTGIKKLIFTVDLTEETVDSYEIAFKIVPALNAAGRLTTADDAIKLLLCGDFDEAMRLAVEISYQNTKRRGVCQSVLLDCMETMGSYDLGKYKIIVLSGEGWTEGVLGIAASKLSEYFHLPVILLTEGGDGNLKGSARSIKGIDICECLKSCEELLLKYGGHSMAAGLSLKKSNFRKFKEAVNDSVRENDGETFVRAPEYDIAFHMDDFNELLTEAVELLEPFGCRNPNPKFFDDRPSFELKRFGNTKHAKNTKFFDANEIVMFRGGDMAEPFNRCAEKNIIYTVEKNYYAGRLTRQFVIRDTKLAYYDLAEDTLLERFLLFTLKIRDREPLKAKRNKYPKLRVCFGKTAYSSMSENNPDLKIVYGMSEKMDVCDTLLYSPKVSFPFRLYGEVLLDERLPGPIERFFNFDSKKCTKLPFCNLKINVDRMRKVYSELKKFFGGGGKFFNAAVLYSDNMFEDKGIDYKSFLLYLYTMTEVGLIKRIDDDIIKLSSEEVDLNKSEIYGYFNGIE